MTTLYFRHNKTKKRYRIVSIDEEKGTITLEGQNGSFTEPYDKERFVKLGYVLEQEQSDAVQS